MMRRFPPALPALLWCVLAGFQGPTCGAELPKPAAGKPKLEYNRDVRPILADACFRCHGFDKNTREAGLRLDTFDGATADREGTRAVVPGKLAESLLHQRIRSQDADEAMPPADAPRQLSEKEKAILERWIAEGAEYQEHWAYIPPVRPAVPAVDEPGFVRNPIDRFALQRQRAIGVAHVAPADKETLCRRVYLDLLGLPPTPAEVEAFVNDPAPDAYEKLVDRLLARDEHAERLAVWWLDLVRFADTIGYHSDNPRNVWPYRDYVIRSFRENKPFDRFTLEQVAGDLLPDADRETRVAAAYNRLLLTTEEGGAQAKQYEAKHVVDRVKSIGTTWLGQTLMCAECHDHKYDPVTTRDFYALGAFFADIQEGSIGRREEGMLVTSPADDARLAALDAEIAALRGRVEALPPERAAALTKWEDESAVDPTAIGVWQPLQVVDVQADAAEIKANVDGKTRDLVRVAGKGTKDGVGLTLTAKGNFRDTKGFRLEALADPKLPQSGPGRASNGNFVLTEIRLERIAADGSATPVKFAGASADFEQEGFRAAQTIDGDRTTQRNGWAVMGGVGKDRTLFLELPPEALTDEEVTLRFVLDFRYDATHHLGKFRLASTRTPGAAKAGSGKLPPEVVAALGVPRGKRNAKQQETLRKHWQTLAPETAADRTALAAAEKAKADFEKALPRCLTSVSMSNPRTVRILPRGDWTNETGEVVLPATPKFLPGYVESTAGKRLNRLDLARWLIARENPLTARVAVNRLWKQFHGIGLVKSLEDVGTQAETPVHQALLDWLAVEFVESGWNVRHVVRLMTTCGVYRQSSTAPAALRERDPENRELARAGRWRLDAEFVRDNALAISGLLVRKVGGPSVKPYQPAGYWENLNFPAREWQNDRGSDQWRRGLYTWWQRSYPHPGMSAFDAPSREECAADRVRSNLPQQALVLLNDPTYVEAARAFAIRMLREGGPDERSRLAWGWREALGRSPRPEELALLEKLLASARDRLKDDVDGSIKQLRVGQAPVPEDLPFTEAAAYLAPARAILNLHETITRF